MKPNQHLNTISRRDFLKLSGAVSTIPFCGEPYSFNSKIYLDGSTKPNIIVLVFDTMSANNLSLYGYPRRTSPNIERFAERAFVYHQHYSIANFTVPSTASLFTSTFPWQHKAFTLRGLVTPEILPNNIFNLIEEKYFTTSYAQNLYADMLIQQFNKNIKKYVSSDEFNYLGDFLYTQLPGEEAISGLKSFDQFMIRPQERRGSLFLSVLYDIYYLLRYRMNSKELLTHHPIGIPHFVDAYGHFLMDDLFEGIISLVRDKPSPLFSYIHIFPPHRPACPTEDFFGMFDDGWIPDQHEEHPLSNRKNLDYQKNRQLYDEYIANVDFEFGKLLSYFEQSGLMDSSYIILTTDHGELFDFGYIGHTNPLLYQPLIRIPLIISCPGQNARKDIFAFTSNIDLPPTFLHFAEKPIPENYEGKVLPGIGGEEESDRILWAFEARNNSIHGPLNEVTLALIQDPYKLIYYYGYEEYKDQYELYNLREDPSENVNLFYSDPSSDELKQILDQQFLKILQIFNTN